MKDVENLPQKNKQHPGQASLQVPVCTAHDLDRLLFQIYLTTISKDPKWQFFRDQKINQHVISTWNKIEAKINKQQKETQKKSEFQTFFFQTCFFVLNIGVIPPILRAPKQANAPSPAWS